MPIGHRPDRGKRGEQSRDVELHRIPQERVLAAVSGRAHRTGGPDAAVEIVGNEREKQHEHQRREHPVDQEGPEWQTEHVVAGVAPEHRVLPTEVLAVVEQHPGRPASRRVQPGNQPEQRRDGKPNRRGMWGDRLVEPFDHVVGFVGRPEGRGKTVRQVEVAPQQGEEQEPEEGDERELGTDDLVPHRDQPQLVEPEPVGVDTGDAIRRQEEHDDQPEQTEDRHPCRGRPGKADRAHRCEGYRLRPSGKARVKSDWLFRTLNPRAANDGWPTRPSPGRTVRRWSARQRTA